VTADRSPFETVTAIEPVTAESLWTSAQFEMLPLESVFTSHIELSPPLNWFVEPARRQLCYRRDLCARLDCDCTCFHGSIACDAKHNRPRRVLQLLRYPVSGGGGDLECIGD
jgi:hypothetical protein